MKFRYKVLFINIIILALVLSVSGYLMMSRQNRLMMDEQIKNSVTENNIIEAAIEYSLLDVINDSSLSVRNQLPAISERVSAGMLSSSTELSITYDSDIIFSTSDVSGYPSGDLIDSDLSSRKKYQIRKEEAKTFVYVMSSLYIDDAIVNVITKRDISVTTKMINDNTNYFRFFIVVILIITGFIVYIITLLLTRPLEKLNKVTDDFAEGDFSTRSNIRSQDEIGLLSDKFNHMADSVEDHIDELNDMLHRRDQFVADFTHEIKTPMTTIIGYADTIRSVELPREDEVRAAHYIFSEGKRLEQMSQHLFDLIYLKDGKLPKTPVNTVGLGEAVVETVLPAIERAGITLEYRFENANITGDSALLKTAFINLLDNALKASSEGKSISFTGRIIEGSQNYEFIVEDHGIGIAKEDIDKICDEFYMVDKSRSRSRNGVGLGLALCTEILKLHGSELEIESTVGEGSCISFTIAEAADEYEAG